MQSPLLLHPYLLLASTLLDAAAVNAFVSNANNAGFGVVGVDNNNNAQPQLASASASVVTTQSSTRDRFSTIQLNAAAANNDDDDGKGNIFEQAFKNLQKMPWDDNANTSDDDNNNGPSSSKPQAAAQKPRKRKPRTPRYPSALQANGSSNNNGPPAASTETKSSEVDEYVKSAQDAVRPIIMSTNKEVEASVTKSEGVETTNQATKQRKKEPRKVTKPKLGILLIDHGSKRKASNDFLFAIADSYQSAWDDKLLLLSNKDGDAAATMNSPIVIVTAAHMEIAPPSILTQLRTLISEEEVTVAICIPYFLSPGKHATIDVPNLIEEAKAALEEEGSLDYYYNGRSVDDGGSSKARVVEVVMAKSLGTNVGSMLGVVDGLVEDALEGMGGGGADGENEKMIDDISDLLIGGNGDQIIDVNNGSNDDAARIEEENNELLEAKEEELRKYTNRAALLEITLQAKVKELKTMTNRVTLMEDAIKIVQAKLKTEQEENGQKISEVELQFEGQVANLTIAIEAIRLEKDKLVTEVESLEVQTAEMEAGYDVIVSNLKSTIVYMEEELEELLDKKGKEEEGQKEEEASTNSDMEGLQKKIEHQENKIQELQTQLADLLDAHTELEQLQQDTEATVAQYKEQLEDLDEGHQTSLKVEQDEKEEYKSKWTEVQRQLEEDGAKLESMLNEASAKYNQLLDEEKGVSNEWKEKWIALNDTLTATNDGANTTIIASIPEENGEELVNLQNQLEEMTMAKTNATNKVQELEEEVQQLQSDQQQQEQDKSSSSDKLQKELEQQQQMQQYLQGQISNYYERIELQTSQIDEYQKQIKDMEQSHEESMLIATNSVEASQQREEKLLTNIEELENELTLAKQEKDDGGKLLSELQARLDEMKSEAAAVVGAATATEKSSHDDSSLEVLARQNKELAIEIGQLQITVQMAKDEKERILIKKTKLEEEVAKLPFLPRRVMDMLESSGVATKALAAEDESKQSHEGGSGRRLSRPWTWFRRRCGEVGAE